MNVSLFIAKRLNFKGKIAMVCIAVSFLVMIIAVSVASGYRKEIRDGISSVSGDVLITAPDRNVFNEFRPIEASPAYLPYLDSLEAVVKVIPTVYRAGIVKDDDNMYGVVFKGTPDLVDTTDLAVSIPSALAQKAGVGVGDKILTYFVGHKLKARQFYIADIHETLVETDNQYVIYASNSDLQRLNGWSDGEVSALEVILHDKFKTESGISEATDEIGSLINAYSSEDERSVIATSVLSRFPQLFSWLDLIDFNVYFILLLMTIVAGFNMISGLLIMLFEHISTIGLLKSLGMTDRAITKVFLASSAMVVGKGMLIGNILAILFCIIQVTTHILKLNPENYYVSFVPVNIDFGLVLIADLISFAGIMILLLIPCLFISKVDPAETVRVR